jgi:hypothetical protein
MPRPRRPEPRWDTRSRRHRSVSDVSPTRRLRLYDDMSTTGRIGRRWRWGGPEGVVGGVAARRVGSDRVREVVTGRKGK